MSYLKCHDCEVMINTDDPEGCEWIEIGNMRRQTEEICICLDCYESRVEQHEHRADQEARAMGDAERHQARIDAADNALLKAEQAMEEAKKADGNSTD